MRADSSLVAVLLTFNSAAVIERSVSAAQRVASAVLCVDSGSTDGTQEIVERLGCRLLLRPFTTYSDQRNWAIKQVEQEFAWQLHLDADEVLDDDAIGSIASAVAASD